MQTVVFVKLVIEASPDDAHGAVDQVLDEGTFQEAVNELLGRDRVKSAISGDADNARAWIGG